MDPRLRKHLYLKSAKCIAVGVLNVLCMLTIYISIGFTGAVLIVGDIIDHRFIVFTNFVATAMTGIGALGLAKPLVGAALLNIPRRKKGISIFELRKVYRKYEVEMPRTIAWLDHPQRLYTLFTLLLGGGLLLGVLFPPPILLS